ncbi:hypothetical protein LK07_13435 [Streptomyces pluripotens]|uniref:Uncharacterized protein n=1 Tax=Streptomyces pluripotens TaxID=1355015 RepID=A0A221NY50_9ACTN|nr:MULTISPECIES: hypothetical protein [Streptomyces]ARP70620.1 hypothetical protein LK06_012305 [Streptomyces pluripotens]ASN24880.1 hypothetical protein LK07_13435 [Streptomyces pluripotens]MCH0556692.1 hypothetical protein [Streptomyces sp. MUM 16J]
MNVNGSNGSERADPREAPIPCPKSLLPLIDQNGHRPAGRTPARPVDAVDSRECALLMRAFAQANTGLAKAQTPLGELGTELLRTFQSAQSAIDAVERLTVGRSAGEARCQVGAVRARHAADGPESLRGSRRPWAWLQWVMLAFSALFDLPFVGEAMTRLLDVAPKGFWGITVYGFCYLAALGVSCLQFALASLLARSLFRQRVRAGRRTQRVRLGPRALWRHWWRLDGPRVETRRPDDLPWAGLTLPVLANVLLIGLLAATAHSRAKESHQVTATFGENGYLMAVFLIVALGLATVATTVLAHNPYAESDSAAKDALSAVEAEVKALVPEARGRLAAHKASWHRLFAAVHQATVDAQRVVDDACALIVEERAETGLAGTLDMPLRDYAWPAEQDRSEDGGGTDRPRPPLRQLDPLDHYRNGLLGRYAPDVLEDLLEDIVGELTIQFELGDMEAPTALLPPPAGEPPTTPPPPPAEEPPSPPAPAG